jgi:myo-inositol-1(or 4)-monophosphatase
VPAIPLADLPADLVWAIRQARAAAADAAAHLGTAERLTKTHATTSDEAVTEHDRAVQRRLLAAIRARCPDDGLLGEESDDGDGITNLPPVRGDRVWVIDPLDGTNNFVAGFGAVGVCVGRLAAGTPDLGVVHDLARGETWCGMPGHGAWRVVGEEAWPVHAQTGALTAKSLVMLTSNLLDRDGRIPAPVQAWLHQLVWKPRMLGSAALEAALVGGGIAHAAYSPNAKLWDLVAAAAVVLAAGGVVSGPTGTPVFPYPVAGYTGAKVPFLVGGPAAHRQLVADLAG